MFKPISELFEDKAPSVTGADVRVYIESLLQRETKSDKVYCVQVQGGVASVRVGAPTLFQEVYARQQAIKTTVKLELGYALAEIRITPSYY